MMVAGGAEFSHLFYTEFGRPGLAAIIQRNRIVALRLSVTRIVVMIILLFTQK